MSAYKLFQDFGEKLKVFPHHWATFCLAGSFALYVLGYLAVRFHLTTLGVGTDLSVLDERYLFAGTKFVVYFVASVLNVIFFGLIVAAIGYLPFRLVSRRRAKTEVPRDAARSANVRGGWSSPERLSLLGIIFSLLMSQLFMRQSFFLGNLLVAPSLPEHPRWLLDLLTAADDFGLGLYFTGLVAATLISATLLISVARGRPSRLACQVLFWTLAFLVAAETLFLPVNYGALIVDKYLPRLASLDGEDPLRPGEDAWLAWEGSSGITYLVRKRTDGGVTRSLITLHQKDVKKVEVVGYDRILWELFGKR